MMFLPSTSIAESTSVEERLDNEEIIQKHSEENLIIKDNPFGPTIILRMLLWTRNLFILSLVGIILVVMRLRDLLNRSSSAVQT